MSTALRRMAGLLFAGTLGLLALGEDAGEDSVSLLQKDASWRKRGRNFPPVAFIKTHKTGSTTLSNQLFRLGEERNKTFMLSCDASGNCGGSGKLGWPWDFPGPTAESAWGAPRHQFDVLCNHAVYDDALMRSFLKPAPLFVTLLREPSEQLRSAFDYFKPKVPTSWKARLQALRDMDAGSDEHNWARFINPQATDLGWQRFALARLGPGANMSELVHDWLTELHGNMSLVLIREYYDQGLVLLARKLRLAPRDMAYVQVKPAPYVPTPEEAEAMLQIPPKPPSLEPRELEELRRLEHVDFELYRFFNTTFWEAWSAEGGDAVLAEELRELRRHSALLEDRVCKDGLSIQEAERSNCDWRLTANDVQYPEYLLRHNQVQKNLLLQTSA